LLAGSGLLSRTSPTTPPGHLGRKWDAGTAGLTGRAVARWLSHAGADGVALIAILGACMFRLWLLVLVSVSLWGCVKPLQGPEADLAATAAPDPAPPPPAPRVPPALPAGPVLGAGEFKAWVPPQVQPNGDRIEGHWLVISLTPPASETMEPVTPMPRAP